MAGYATINDQTLLTNALFQRGVGSHVPEGLATPSSEKPGKKQCINLNSLTCVRDSHTASWCGDQFNWCCGCRPVCLTNLFTSVTGLASAGKEFSRTSRHLLSFHATNVSMSGRSRLDIHAENFQAKKKILFCLSGVATSLAGTFSTPSPKIFGDAPAQTEQSVKNKVQLSRAHVVNHQRCAE